MLQNNQRNLRGDWWARIVTWGSRHPGLAPCFKRRKNWFNHVVIDDQDTDVRVLTVALKFDIPCHIYQWTGTETRE